MEKISTLYSLLKSNYYSSTYIGNNVPLAQSLYRESSISKVKSTVQLVGQNSNIISGLGTVSPPLVPN